MSIRPKMRTMIGLDDLAHQRGRITDPRFQFTGDDPPWETTNTVPMPPPLDPVALDAALDAGQHLWAETLGSQEDTRRLLAEYPGIRSCWHHGCADADGAHVIGFVLSTSDDEAFISALAALHSTYAETAATPIPAVAPQGLYGAYYRKMLAFVHAHPDVVPLVSLLRFARQHREAFLVAARVHRAVRYGQYNNLFDPTALKTRIDAALWLFWSFGFEVSRKDMRIFLYTEWS